MEIHIDYIIYFLNFVIYIVLCGFLIKQAKQDIFAPKTEQKKTPLCLKHGCPLDVPHSYEEGIHRR